MLKWHRGYQYDFLCMYNIPKCKVLRVKTLVLTFTKTEEICDWLLWLRGDAHKANDTKIHSLQYISLIVLHDLLSLSQQSHNWSRISAWPRISPKINPERTL